MLWLQWGGVAMKAMRLAMISPRWSTAYAGLFLIISTFFSLRAYRIFTTAVEVVVLLSLCRARESTNARKLETQAWKEDGDKQAR